MKVYFRGVRLERALCFLCACLLALAVCPIAPGQRPVPPAGAGAPPPVPTTILYHSFFRRVEAFERSAAAADERGENGNELRQFYKGVLGLSVSEDARLKQSARRVDIENSKIAFQMDKIIREFRDNLPKYDGSFNGELPPPPAELESLFQKQEALIEAEIETLRVSMGQETFEKIDSYLKEVHARGFSSVEIPSVPTVGFPGAGATGVNQQ